MIAFGAAWHINRHISNTDVRALRKTLRKLIPPLQPPPEQSIAETLDVDTTVLLTFRRAGFWYWLKIIMESNSKKDGGHVVRVIPLRLMHDSTKSYHQALGNFLRKTGDKHASIATSGLEDELKQAIEGVLKGIKGSTVGVERYLDKVHNLLIFGEPLSTVVPLSILPGIFKEGQLPNLTQLTTFDNLLNVEPRLPLSTAAVFPESGDAYCPRFSENFDKVLTIPPDESRPDSLQQALDHKVHVLHICSPALRHPDPNISGIQLGNTILSTLDIEKHDMRGVFLVVLANIRGQDYTPDLHFQNTDLPHAFIKAGAKTVISSYWPVPKDMARLVFLKFYQLMPLCENDVSSALHLAQHWLVNATVDEINALLKINDVNKEVSTNTYQNPFNQFAFYTLI